MSGLRSRFVVVENEPELGRVSSQDSAPDGLSDQGDDTHLHAAKVRRHGRGAGVRSPRKLKVLLSPGPISSKVSSSCDPS